MTDALTPSQVQVLRRVRDGQLWSAESPPENELGEARFLAALGLLEYVELGIFELSARGEEALERIEESTTGDGPPG